ncbi:hypothetical protein [Elizabethkingia ursingii]|uniref:Immunity protein 40 domain-containing protein n=1 Tax=Elizabethkingia ursingii TaxID=1756150 RepID=A0ABX3N888_9FLAO|nr:hypothetical protein [Elizabethkingia ursingii]OPB88529.1 hypothetical protein BB021_08255 [Elizabethkingia ursingii]
MEINSGSAEVALTVADALQALDLLDGSGVAILGGDVLAEKESGELIYAYQFWGDGQECHYLNWYSIPKIKAILLCIFIEKIQLSL